MSPLLYRNFLKNHFQKLFYFLKLFINISQASLLALINYLSHYEVLQKTATKSGRHQVIYRKETLLFWIASLPFAHSVRLSAMTKLLTVITRATPEVIYSLDCFAFAKGGQSSKMLAMTWKIKIAMTRLFIVITRLFIAEVIYLVDCHDFGRSLAMTITKIFNLISFRDYSLLFIKNLLLKEI